jgi:hypothetical protein
VARIALTFTKKANYANMRALATGCSAQLIDRRFVEPGRSSKLAPAAAYAPDTLWARAAEKRLKLDRDGRSTRCQDKAARTTVTGTEMKKAR